LVFSHLLSLGLMQLISQLGKHSLFFLDGVFSRLDLLS